MRRPRPGGSCRECFQDSFSIDALRVRRSAIKLDRRTGRPQGCYVLRRGRLAAGLLLHVLRDGSYRIHTENLRERLSCAMTEFSIRLKAVGIVPWLEPEAGMFLWCRRPDGIDVA